MRADGQVHIYGLAATSGFETPHPLPPPTPHSPYRTTLLWQQSGPLTEVSVSHISHSWDPPRSGSMCRGSTIPDGAGYTRGSTIPSGAGYTRGSTIPSGAGCTRGSTVPSGAGCTQTKRGSVEREVDVGGGASEGVRQATPRSVVVVCRRSGRLGELEFSILKRAFYTYYRFLNLSRKPSQL